MCQMSMSSMCRLHHPSRTSLPRACLDLQLHLGNSKLPALPRCNSHSGCRPGPTRGMQILDRCTSILSRLHLLQRCHSNESTCPVQLTQWLQIASHTNSMGTIYRCRRILSRSCLLQRHHDSLGALSVLGNCLQCICHE